MQQTEPKLSDNLPLSEHGTALLDRAFYHWAIGQNSHGASLQKIDWQFDALVKAYDDDARVFHRGLGHPRSLFPDIAQVLYKSLLHKNLSFDEAVIQIHKLALTMLPKQSELLTETQGVIAAYYHDVVHRAGKKPEALELYSNKDAFEANPIRVPITHLLLQGEKAKTPEELSCIVAEDALRKLKVSDEAILTILVAIDATKPFDECSEPEHIESSLFRIADQRKVIIHIDSAIQVAIGLANRDLGSYGEDSFDLFNKKSWAMMLERYPSLKEQNHSLADEAKAIADFYDSHRKLLTRVNKGLKIYHGEIDDVRIQQLNAKAVETIQHDIILQGVQLASLLLNMAVKQKDNVDAADILWKYELTRQLHPSKIPAEVEAVLEQHDKLCLVNGQEIHRGTSNAKLALRFVKLIGKDNLLEIANNYADISSLDFETTMEKLTRRVVPVSDSLMQHGSFPPPGKRRALMHAITGDEPENKINQDVITEPEGVMPSSQGSLGL